MSIFYYFLSHGLWFWILTFSDCYDQWNRSIESTLYWAFCLFSFYIEVRGCSIGLRDIRVILINTTKLCDPDGRWDTERHSVGLAVSESLTSDSTLTPVICRRQHLSGEKPTNIKHFTQHQTETGRTASRCISTIYLHSYNLRWRSFCASRLFLRHNSIRYNSICGDICLNKMFYHQNSEQHESSHLGKMLRNWRHEQGAEDFQSQPNQWLLECCDLQRLSWPSLEWLMAI